MAVALPGPSTPDGTAASPRPADASAPPAAPGARTTDVGARPAVTSDRPGGVTSRPADAPGVRTSVGESATASSRPAVTSDRPGDAHRPMPRGRRDLDRIIENVLDHSVALFAADKAGLWTVEDGDHPFRLAAHRGLGPPFLAGVADVERGSTSAGWRAVASRRTIVLQHPWSNDVRAEQAARYDAEGFRTICLVPVAYLDEPLGLLALHHTRRHDWPTEELDLVASVADEVAMALQNARLYASVRDFAARLDAIQDLAGRLNRLHDPTEIGHVIVAEVRGLFASDTARVYRVDRAAGMCEPIAFGGTFLGVSDPD